VIIVALETRLGWFGHVERRTMDSVVRRVDQMEKSQITRGRGRPRKTIRETIRKDLEMNELEKDMVFDRTPWRCWIHVANPTYWDKVLVVVIVVVALNGIKLVSFCLYLGPSNPFRKKNH